MRIEWRVGDGEVLLGVLIIKVGNAATLAKSFRMPAFLIQLAREKASVTKLRLWKKCGLYSVDFAGDGGTRSIEELHFMDQPINS